MKSIADQLSRSVSAVSHMTHRLRVEGLIPEYMRPVSVKCTSNIPFVKQLFELVKDSDMSHERISVRAGYSLSMTYSWFRNETAPTLASFSDVLEVLGYELTIRKKEAPITDT